ncbi:MAG: hypothetical protein IJ777_03740 [Clostridia bacterium]|nr:hypothetical protein [Clostridia bacterium]
MLKYKDDGSSNANYWLASRAVACRGDGLAGFEMRGVYSGNVNASDVFLSKGIANNYNSRGVRPVVSLESGVKLTEKVGDTWKLGK